MTTAALRRGAPKLRVSWQQPKTRAAGVSYGYHHLITRMSECIENDPSCPIALHCTPPQRFVATPDKVNVLYTMWESRDFPVADLPNLRQADVIIVPSNFCVRVFERVADCPVHLVPLGVDVDLYAYKKRRPPARTKEDPFIWFWCASPDPRKGWGIVARAWNLAFGGDPTMLLYMKSSGTDNPRYELTNNILVDQRNLEPHKLAELFAGAHGFLYPSMAEGFGLTVAEAMSSGLPVVGTQWSGHADFLDASTAWPVRTQLQRLAAYEERKSDAEDGLFELAVTDTLDLVRQMQAVMTHYKLAQKRAEHAAKLMRARYTWTKFAAGLAAVVERVRLSI